MAKCGTPEGYKAGCRGANCTNHKTDLMTCTEAAIRYRGDWQYRKQVDAGTATAAKEVFARPAKPKVLKPVVVKAPKPARVPKPKTVRPPREPKAPKPPKQPKPVYPHGTTQSQMRACKSGCPNEETCTQKRTRMQRTVMARIKAREIPANLHGSRTGYSYGCHKGSPCPGGPDGKTCSQAVNEYKRAAYRKKVDAA